GLIFDRNGVLLAENRPSFTLVLHPNKIEDLTKTLAELETLVTVLETDKQRFEARLQRTRRLGEGVPLRFDLDEAEQARLAVNQHKWVGVDVEAELIRHYPLAELTAHVVGYVGRINEREEAKIDKAAYAGTQHIGKIGLERFYESRLLGTVGSERVESDARGRISRVLERIDPQPGQNLSLFLDTTVQRVAQEALGDRRGAVVAIELPTGGVVAMTSTPSFDSNLFVQGIDHQTYNKLNQTQDRPLYNRALKGQYPPGSTIKPLVALAALERGVANWEYRLWDPGFYQLEGGDHQYRDWKKGGHGWVDMHSAIVQSCDTYFYELSHRLEIDAMHDFLSLFGLGQETEIDLGGEGSGILPSRAWKRASRGQVWYPGETLITGIGQGFMLATPLQLAYAIAVLATEGQTSRPRLWREAPTLPVWSESILNDVDGREHSADVSQRRAPWREENGARIIQAMEDVVHSPRGTARRLGKDAAYKIAGKSGTAQVLGVPQGEKYDAEAIAERYRDHALFVAFAPVDNPLIAVAVIVENGGSGGGTAGPVARAVMDAYLLGTTGSRDAVSLGSGG
ncbi:MAG: penicillin-binding protein 2, partial [Gammaproteobacteria bacterium]